NQRCEEGSPPYSWRDGYQSFPMPGGFDLRPRREWHACLRNQWPKPSSGPLRLSAAMQLVRAAPSPDVSSTKKVVWSSAWLHIFHIVLTGNRPTGVHPNHFAGHWIRTLPQQKIGDAGNLIGLDQCSLDRLFVFQELKNLPIRLRAGAHRGSHETRSQHIQSNPVRGVVSGRGKCHGLHCSLARGISHRGKPLALGEAREAAADVE